jgi:hypothetical protein
VSDFIVASLLVEQVPLDQKDQFAAAARFALALQDGRRYDVTFSMNCKGNLPMTLQIIRTCTTGVPFLKKRNGQAVTSASFPDDCPIDGNDPAIVHFNQTLQRVLSHSIMKTAVPGWSETRRKGDASPELRSSLDSFCRREWKSMAKLLKHNADINHTSKQFIRELAGNISEPSFYEVTCDHVSFAGVVTWLSLSWPFFTMWFTISHIMVPIIYKRFAKQVGVIGSGTTHSVVATDHLEATQPRRELGDRKTMAVAESETEPPIRMSSVGSAKEDDVGEKLHVDSNVSEDVDRDCNLCTDEYSAKPFAGDGAVTSDWDAARELVVPQVMNLLHCLVDAAVSKHVDRIRSEIMSMDVAESRMPARHVHLDGCLTSLEEDDATQYGSVQCDAAANGGPRVVHNIASIVEDLQECQRAIAALSSHCCTLETMFCRTTTRNTVTEEDAHGVDVGECTRGDVSQRNSLLRGSVDDPLLMAEASTRSAITLLVCRLEQSLAILPRCTAVDTASRHLDQFREGWQLRAGGIIDTGTSMRRTKCQL